MMEEMLSLVKELKTEDGQKEFSASESGTKGDEEQRTFIVQLLGIKRNVEELQEKEEQPFPDCQRDGKEEKKGGSRRSESGRRKVKVWLTKRKARE